MTPYSEKGLLPAGLRDGLPPQAAWEARVIELLLDGFGRHGYQRVKPPLIEFEETLLPKWLALPIFASDPLSSNAYATEEALVVLVGAAGLSQAHLVFPLAAAIALLLGIVILSYRQTVRVYETSGGAYIVARENLGTAPSLVAAAALLTDYVLTVAVSISAGIFAITSFVPSLGSHRVSLSLACLGLIVDRKSVV